MISLLLPTQAFYRFILSLTCILVLLPSQVGAIDIGSLTATMGPKQDFINRMVMNTGSITRVYQVNAVKLDTPKITGNESKIMGGELLFSPKQFSLAPAQRQNVKLYYKGPQDNTERYYRVTFTELAHVAHGGKEENSTISGALDLKTSIRSILVVRPRNTHFDYKINLTEGYIKNTGNTYFEFMVKQGCNQSDSDADSRFLLPGETYHNEKLLGDRNQKFIVYDNNFVQIGKACWKQ